MKSQRLKNTREIELYCQEKNIGCEKSQCDHHRAFFFSSFGAQRVKRFGRLVFEDLVDG